LRNDVSTENREWPWTAVNLALCAKRKRGNAMKGYKLAGSVGVLQALMNLYLAAENPYCLLDVAILGFLSWMAFTRRDWGVYTLLGYSTLSFLLLTFVIGSHPWIGALVLYIIAAAMVHRMRQREKGHCASPHINPLPKEESVAASGPRHDTP